MKEKNYRNNKKKNRIGTNKKSDIREEREIDKECQFRKQVE